MIEQNPSPDRLAQAARDVYRAHFGSSPQWIAQAPGRVNLIGEHTDYNDGFVLPMAIERYVVLAAGPASSPGGKGRSASYQVHSTHSGRTVSWPAEAGPAGEQGSWSSYVRGVLELCRQRGLDTGPMNIVVHSTVPVGGGLSSSAALEVATATLVEAVTARRSTQSRRRCCASGPNTSMPESPAGSWTNSVRSSGAPAT